MTKYIVGVIIIIIVLAGGWYLWKGMGGASSMTPPSAVTTSTQVATSSYMGTGFTIVYPSDFTVNPSFQYTEVANKPIDGVSFTIPGSMATGTNLASDSYLSVESLPRAKECTGDIYLPENVKSATVNENGIEYSVASSSDVAAGNDYEEIVYALPSSSPCIAVRYYIHSSDINNYTPGTVQAFDETALMSAFDAIRDSLVLGATPAATQ